MRMTDLLEVLLELNPWWRNREFELGKPREGYLSTMERKLRTGEILAVTGVRRAGKTTLIKQLIKRLLDRGVDPRSILFVNCEEPVIANREDPFGELLETYRREIHPGEEVYLIFDEIQNIEGWQGWIKALYDRNRYQIVISGSSSELLESKLSSKLGGRYLQTVVHPLDFREFLQFKGWDLSGRIDLLSKKYQLIQSLSEYLRWGGFPQVVMESDEATRADYLKTYYDSILYRDVGLTYRLRNERVVRELSYYLLSNLPSPFSYNRLGEAMNVDFKTAKEYIGYLERARMVFEVPFFSHSPKTQARNEKKAYCIDNGLRNAVSFVFSRDEGRLAENLVFLEILRRGEKPYYWKGSREVDFVVRGEDGNLTAINVSYTDSPLDREIEGLREFQEEFGEKVGGLMLITRDFDASEEGIEVLPLWRWMLGI
ncbi:MAG: ATP-binding protein [Methanomassiliicoccales archaeon]